MEAFLKTFMISPLVDIVLDYTYPYKTNYNYCMRLIIMSGINLNMYPTHHTTRHCLWSVSDSDMYWGIDDQTHMYCWGEVMNELEDRFGL